MPTNTSQRAVVETGITQGEDERIVYTLTTTPWGSSPTSVSVVVKDTHSSYADVTATVMPSGSATVAGDVITLPILRDLTNRHVYRVEVKFTSGGNLFEPYFIVTAER